MATTRFPPKVAGSCSRHPGEHDVTRWGAGLSSAPIEQPMRPKPLDPAGTVLSPSRGSLLKNQHRRRK
jgi:hypothetical protein